jgi:hypothetical protein
VKQIEVLESPVLIEATFRCNDYMRLVGEADTKKTLFQRLQRFRVR